MFCHILQINFAADLNTARFIMNRDAKLLDSYENTHHRRLRESTIEERTQLKLEEVETVLLDSPDSRQDAFKKLGQDWKRDIQV